MIVALFKSAKFWVAAGVITAVITFATWGYHQIYEAGYNAAELEWRTAQQEAINRAVADARRETAIAYAAAMENLETETEIIERVRVVEREVPKIVERVVAPECRDLGSDIQRLFNDAIRAGLPAPEGAGNPAEPAR